MHASVEGWMEDLTGELEQRGPEDPTSVDQALEDLDEMMAKSGTEIESDERKSVDPARLLQFRKTMVKSKSRYTGIRWVSECDEQTSSND